MAGVTIQVLYFVRSPKRATVIHVRHGRCPRFSIMGCPHCSPEREEFTEALEALGRVVDATLESMAEYMSKNDKQDQEEQQWQRVRDSDTRRSDRMVVGTRSRRTENSSGPATPRWLRQRQKRKRRERLRQTA